MATGLRTLLIWFKCCNHLSTKHVGDYANVIFFFTAKFCHSLTDLYVCQLNSLYTVFMTTLLS